MYAPHLRQVHYSSREDVILMLFARKALKKSNTQGVRVNRKPDEVKIYFRPYEHHPDKDKIDRALQKFAFENKCMSSDTSMITQGSITVRFNPVVHDRKTRDNTTSRIVKIIERT
jgi:glycine cleavage system protein P-like pyridoxal-binding family